MLLANSFVKYFAKIAQLVEHDLAKVGVAGSSPVFRSLSEMSGREVYPDGESGSPVFRSLSEMSGREVYPDGESGSPVFRS